MSPAALEKMESEAASANNSQTDSAAATVDPSEARFSEFCKVFFFPQVHCYQCYVSLYAFKLRFVRFNSLFVFSFYCLLSLALLSFYKRKVSFL